ncbi:MAG: hypothetical protein F4Y80_17710 [Caldilineaceae bacterium SB0665_bin_21]|nr:hypothetical protein [Caldilineaceae bacterium SB0665_bin_21]MYA04360.1 hypothetical protein [Caldilineaceae bacterium SB0664_bin_22]MYC61950.1 hypothetical protein [Caldilineaceae bacterium SB0661_bin_34]
MANIQRASLSGRYGNWSPRAVVAAVLVALFGLVALPETAQAQELACQDEPSVLEQLTTRAHAWTCIAEPWHVFDLASDSWKPMSDLSNVQQAQLQVYTTSFKAGRFDDFVVGDSPAWQGSGNLAWQREFAAVGFRDAGKGNLFAVAMWVDNAVDFDAFDAQVASHSDSWEAVTLTTRNIPWLEEDAAPQQQAWLLSGGQARSLLDLDGSFANNRYLVVEPTPALRALGGMPILAFFSSTPIPTEDLSDLLDSLHFVHTLPPTNPDPDLVFQSEATTGLLALIPSLAQAGQAIIDNQIQTIQASAVEFAQEMPFTALLPWQLMTATSDLYWAPYGLHSGRLILWFYTGGAHGNLSVDTWTFTGAGNPVALTDLLAVSQDEALALIVQAAKEHRTAALDPEQDLDMALQWVDDGLQSLDDISGWNPVRRYDGQLWLLITLEPYVIAPWVDGIQEVWVQVPLQDPR